MTAAAEIDLAQDLATDCSVVLFGRSKPVCCCPALPSHRGLGESATHTLRMQHRC
jgi:hypothetical protein